MFKELKFFLPLLVVLNFSSLCAYEYDDDVLGIYSKLSPRFILMSSQKDKIKTEINMCVLHDDVDEVASKTFISKTTNNYPNGLKDYRLKFIDSVYPNLENCKASQLMFLFNTEEKNIISSVEFAKRNKILLLSYDSEILEYGVDVSLFIGRKVTPYVNVDSLKTKDIEFNNVLLRVSKIYQNKEKRK